MSTTNKIDRYTPVEISWYDSVHTCGWSGWKEEAKRIADEDVIVHHTIGYFIETNKLSTIVVQSMQTKIQDDGDRNVDAVMSIPNWSIIRITRFI